MKFIRTIDRGGFGRVDEMEQTDGTRIARKTFSPNVPGTYDAAKMRRRFEREVRIQSKLNHPNIMPILESNLEENPPWFSMPLADESFEIQIERDRSDNTVTTEPWNDILAGVEDLHRLGYVHRDLKPKNVLKLEGRWVVSDFGLVLPTMRDTTVLTGPKSAYGTREYAAPEQATDFRNTPEQADVFALGCMLHDLVADNQARVPFAQATALGPFGAVIEKCTDKNPARRFSTIAALRAVLFDIWRTSSFQAPTGSVADAIQEVLNDPSNPASWRAGLLLVHGEAEERDLFLRAINAEHIEALHRADEIEFGRLAAAMSNWAFESGFEFSYCDVVGDRLMVAYRLANTRLQCQIAIAALELAVSHNRWHVMHQVGRMLNQDASSGLAERMAIELAGDKRRLHQLSTVERIISWRRQDWHPTITRCLNRLLNTGPAAWEDILSGLEEAKQLALAGLYQNAILLSFTDDLIVVGFKKGSMTAEVATEADRVTAMTDFIKERRGGNPKFVIELLEPKAQT